MNSKTLFREKVNRIAGFCKDFANFPVGGYNKKEHKKAPGGGLYEANQSVAVGASVLGAIILLER